MTEDRFREPEDETVDGLFISPEQQRENKPKKLTFLGTGETIRKINIHIIVVPEEEGKENEIERVLFLKTERVLKKTSHENFPNLMQDTSYSFNKLNKSHKSINSMKSIPIHIMNFLKPMIRKKNLGSNQRETTHYL